MDQYLSESSVLDGDNLNITTTTCVSSVNLNAADPPLYLDVGIRALNVFMADVYLLLGNFLNILTLIVIVRYKKLHTLSFAIAAQIAACNIIKASMFSVPTIVNNIVNHWMLGDQVCLLSAFTRHLISTVRGGLFFIFALDRFGVVYFPFKYPRYSCRIVVTTCALMWAITPLLSLAPIPQLLNCYGHIQNDCFIIPKCCRIFLSLWVCLVYFIFSFISAGLFVALYIKGRKIRKEESKMLGLSKKTISNSDWRALNTVSILFGIFLLASFVPLILALIIGQAEGIAHFVITSLVGIFTNVVALTDPIVISKNADAKQACMKLCSDIKEALWCPGKRLKE